MLPLSPLLALAATCPSTPNQDATAARGGLDVKAPVATYVGVESSPAAIPTSLPSNASAASPQPRGERDVARLRPADKVAYDTARDGSVWALGRAYKARFAADGFTYVPFFGSKAPRNFPVTFRLESITVAGVPLTADELAHPTRAQDAVEIDRGGFRERYLTTMDGVEQTFVFDESPRGGDLVVNLLVASELEPFADENGFRFVGAAGEVRYGRAFVYHEDLAPTEIESHLDGHRLRLVVPAEVLATATGPLVIDPVLTTFAYGEVSLDETMADTAYDLTNGTWLSVCERAFSATDHDVLAVRHTSLGALSAAEFVDLSGDDWRAPAVANHNLDDQFLVVAAVGAAPNREIWGRTVEATASLNMSAQFEISDNAFSGDFYLPDVGGDPSTSGTAYYAVVWEREFIANSDYDIHGRLVRTDATLVGPTTILIDNTTATVHRNPAISNSNGVGVDPDQHWNIVWEDEVSSTNRNVLAARMNVAGGLGTGTFTIASSALDERNPTSTSIVNDDGGTRPWMVAFQIDNGANGWDVRCRTLNGTSIVSTFDLSAQFSTVNLDQITPACDTDGDHFLVVYDERTSPVFFGTDLKVASIYTLNGAMGLHEGNLSVSPGAFVDLRPRIATQAASGSLGDQALVVFDRDVGASFDAYATTYQAPDGGPVTSYCSGDGSGTACPCGNAGAAGNGCANSVNAAGGQLTAMGAADVSTDTLVITASGLPGTAPVLFFQGTTQTVSGNGAAFGDGLRCASGTVVRLGVKTASGGVASYGSGSDVNISVAGAVPVTGAVRNLQAWYRDSAVFCTASTFNLTNGLRVQWIP